MIYAYEFDFRNVLVVAVVVVIVLVLCYRLLNRDDRIRKTRFGFFVERERYDDEPKHHIDPEDEETEIPAPIPPPTPPPPLPPPEEETRWPQRDPE